MPRPIKVLVVDDSALVRGILSQGLAQDPELEVVGTAADPFQARDKIVQLKPDVLTLDVEMPRMDGVEFLRHLMPQYPLPVVMVSSLTERGKRITMEALEAGAVDFVSKPKANMADGLRKLLEELRHKVKIASRANVDHFKNRRSNIRPRRNSVRPLAESSHKVIVIGASTGGTEAIKELLGHFPVTTPGCVIVQHMPAGFTTVFAERLHKQVDMEVREAKDGDRVIPGRVLIAPGDYHMQVVRSGGFYSVRCETGEKVCGHCPSVEVLMRSAATSLGANAIGVMLTGMGRDGAEGMKAMRDAGARTLAQDEKSCVVFGMPKVAYEIGGAEQLVSLTSIPDVVLNWLYQEETV
ncbi:MAG: chemotaxis response regulator protein-glutamate methylesterase [bacterium]